MNTKLLFACIYIIVDLTYVYISRGVYNDAVKLIQGNAGFPTGTTRLIAACSAWICMAIGWYFLTTRLVAEWSLMMHPVLAGFLAGLVNGFVVIGTFNLTLHAMFEKWQGAIMIRDMIWGIGWVTIVTMLYSLTIKI
jgi:uncharacterized membrane protein